MQVLDGASTHMGKKRCVFIKTGIVKGDGVSATVESTVVFVIVVGACHRGDCNVGSKDGIDVRAMGCSHLVSEGLPVGGAHDDESALLIVMRVTLLRFGAWDVHVIRGKADRQGGVTTPHKVLTTAVFQLCRVKDAVR